MDLPTLVTTSVENMQRSLSIIADFIQAQKPTEQLAQILGASRRTIFKSQKRGAHPAEYLLP